MIKLVFTDDEGKATKTFTVKDIKTGMVDKCFEFVERAQELDTGQMEIKTTREFYGDLKALLVEVFKGQFTYDELQQNVGQGELLRCYNSVLRYIGITFQSKN